MICVACCRCGRFFKARRLHDRFLDQILVCDNFVRSARSRWRSRRCYFRLGNGGCIARRGRWSHWRRGLGYSRFFNPAKLASRRRYTVPQRFTFVGIALNGVFAEHTQLFPNFQLDLPAILLRGAQVGTNPTYRVSICDFDNASAR